MKPDKKLDAILLRHTPIFEDGFTAYEAAKAYGGSPSNTAHTLDNAVEEGRAEKGWRKIGARWFRVYRVK